LLDYLERILIIMQGILILLVGPLNAQLGYVALVLVMDLILGVMVARKNNIFQMKYFKAKTIEKLIVYTIWIIIGHSADIMINLPNVIRGVILFVMFSREFVSAAKHTGKLGYQDLADALSKKVGPLLESKDLKGGQKKDEQED